MLLFQYADKMAALLLSLLQVIIPSIFNSIYDLLVFPMFKMLSWKPLENTNDHSGKMTETPPVIEKLPLCLLNDAN